MLSIPLSELSELPGFLAPGTAFLASGTLWISKKDPDLKLFLQNGDYYSGPVQLRDHIFFFKVIYEFCLIALLSVPLNNFHYPSSEQWSGGRLGVMAKIRRSKC